MVKDDFFPIEVVDVYQYEIYRKKLLNLREHINENIVNLENDLNFQISNKAKYDDDFFKSFNEAIKKVDLKKNKDNYTLSLSVLLGEIIIKNNGGYWKIIKEYGVYNPYCIPYIVLNDNKVELEVMERIMTDLEQPQYFDLKKSYDFLKDPRLNMHLNVEAQKMYQAIKKDKFGNTED